MFKKIIKGSKDVWCGSLEFDTTPKAGSYNPVTSGGVKEAISEAVSDIASIEAAIPEGAGEEDLLVKSSELNAVDERLENVESKIPSSASSTDRLVTTSELNNATASMESGYTPKGPASVSTLNGLTAQENGDQYIVTDTGTLTYGSLAVTVGESVAWDSINEVWYKVNQYALKRFGTNEVHNIAQTANESDLIAGNYIPVDTPDNLKKLDAETLLQATAQNALAGNVAPAFDESGSTNYHKYDHVVRLGQLYMFNKDHSGSWDPNDVNRVNISTNLFTGGINLSNIDNLTTVGIYRKTGDTPGIVFVANGSNKIFQTVFTTNFTRNEAFILFRSKAVSDESWGVWVEMPIQSYVDESRAFTGTFDLSQIDNFTDIGVYSKTGDTPGTLFVRKTETTITQTLFTSDANNAYISFRKKSGENAWSGWTRMNIDDYATSATAFNGTFSYPSASIDNITSVGLYKKTGDTPGILFVRKTGTNVVQTLFTSDTNLSYIQYRKKSGDSPWSDWIRMDVKDYAVPTQAITSYSTANIFNKFSIVYAELNAETGAVGQYNADYVTSDYMAVKPETSYRFGYWSKRSFYDASKQFISSVTSATAEDSTTPANAAFARVCFVVGGGRKYDIDTYMAFETANPPPSYVVGEEKMYLGECPNNYSNGIKKASTGDSIAETDVSPNLQRLTIEVRSKNLLEPTMQLSMYNSLATITSDTGKYGNVFPVRPGETLYIGGDLSEFNSNSVRIGFTKEYPAPGMVMQNYGGVRTGSSVTVPGGCYWAFWTKGQKDASDITKECFITRAPAATAEYTEYVDVSECSVEVNGVSLLPDAYGKVVVDLRNSNLSVTSLDDVDFYVEYLRDLQIVLNEIGGADVSDIKFVGTGDAAYAVAGKDQTGGEHQSSIVFGYGNARYSGNQKLIIFGKENLQNATGENNSAFGYHSIFRGTSCTMCASFGNEALDDNTSGSYNTGCGNYALQRNTSGNNNTAVGYYALRGDYYAYDVTATWDDCVAVGYKSQAKIKTGGTKNVSVGNSSLESVGTGVGNVAVGDSAMKNAANLSHVIAIGRLAGDAADADYQLWIGSSASGITKTSAIMFGEQNAADMSSQFLRVNGQFELPHLPTSDPHIANRVWNDNGTLKISAG